MSESYRAVLVDGQLHWLDEVPDVIRHATGEVQVRVTVDERGGRNGDELASLLDELAQTDPFRGVDDPVEWQRDLRRD